MPTLEEIRQTVRREAEEERWNPNGAIPQIALDKTNRLHNEDYFLISNNTIQGVNKTTVRFPDSEIEPTAKMAYRQLVSAATSLNPHAARTLVTSTLTHLPQMLMTAKSIPEIQNIINTPKGFINSGGVVIIIPPVLVEILKSWEATLFSNSANVTAGPALAELKRAMFKILELCKRYLYS